MNVKVYPHVVDQQQDVVLEDHDGYKASVRRLASTLNEPLPIDLAQLISLEKMPLLVDAFREHRAAGHDGIDIGRVSLGDSLMLSSIPQIWGAGLNFLAHAKDLEATQDDFPGSYNRPYTCVIANGDAIRIPRQSSRVTAEAELGVVLGKTCKNVSAEDAFDYVLGFTTSLDMTDEGALRQNLRYIAWSKGFDTFASIGPSLILRDQEQFEDLKDIRITTYRNDEIVASNTVSNMKYSIGRLIEYFSAGRTLPAGTVISTGTPGAAVVSPGDTIRAEVSGLDVLEHPVEAA
ncbi:fumarylacetoacetate hydrolase family protein [Streptomyces klenkii]|uniref:Fumarylacetoacetate hydrolase family protein n=1 Tax=Streptomyces klenkii TaxID=1420899 RepID=A0A3B0AU87_9ACTN|nr:fumarylacetoacetate hydrolase family protein [Streptomyces klenkii]RKN62817.1 fumarylacetoacetate hydrolase family protein [Streptomyces klenkii]